MGENEQSFLPLQKILQGPKIYTFFPIAKFLPIRVKRKLELTYWSSQFIETFFLKGWSRNQQPKSLVGLTYSLSTEAKLIEI